MDPAIATILNLSPSSCKLTPHGGSGFSTTSKITAAQPDGTSARQFFLKTGRGPAAATMFAGEHASLNAIAAAVPGFCPRSLGHGALANTPQIYFLVTEFLELAGGGRGKGTGVGKASLARKLATLHTTPAPVPDGCAGPVFGFPVVTCCGETPQVNAYSESWAAFYAENRLRAIYRRSVAGNGADAELERMVERVAAEVVPRLIGDGHLNGGHGVRPVVVHGDLWSGNASSGRIGGEGEVEEVVFDASACYAHSEFDLGIMKMFGGFAGSMKEYHEHCPKTEPVDEYDDRVSLYELYHHLNHYSMFGSGYRSGAVSIMKRLISKYGQKR